MKKSGIYLLIALCCFFTAAYGQNSPASEAGKLFIIGGGDRPAALVERIIRESGLDKGGYGVVLPMSSSEPDTSVFYTKIQFTELGCTNLYGLFCTREQANDPAKADSIRNAKLIYITGGDQSRFMDAVGGTAVEQAIRDAYRNGGMVAGTSAGAAVMSAIMITGNSLKNPEYSSTFKTIEAENIETRAGLGLINRAVIDQHFVQRSRHNRLISAVIEYRGMKGIGIDESTAILVQGSEAEVVGNAQVLVYANPGGSKTVRDGKLGAKGLTLDIYLPGERFSVE